MIKLAEMQDWPDGLCMTAHTALMSKGLLQRSNMSLWFLGSKKRWMQEHNAELVAAAEKVVVFEARRTACVDFVFNGKVVERQDTYRYLGFEFHATQSMTFGAGVLVSAARKAVHAMRRRCAHLHIRDPALQCKLFDSLVKPILSYASEVWAVDPKVGASTEKLHRQFLKQLLRVRNSTTNEMVLAEFGRYPLQTHFWQQVLRFHNRAVQMPNSRLVKLALVDGVQLQNNQVVDSQKKCWRSNVSAFLATQPRHPCLFQNLDVADVVHHQKEAIQSALYTNDQLSSLALYKTLQPDYEYAQYLSSVICFSSRRLVSRFRCGCHGLHVDTVCASTCYLPYGCKPCERDNCACLHEYLSRFSSQKLPREDRVCYVCRSSSVEDEHHFLFDCPVYAHIRDAFATLFQEGPHKVASLIDSSNPTLLGRYLSNCFAHRQFVLEHDCIDV